MLNFKFLQKIIPLAYSLLPFYLRPESSFPPFQVFFEVTYRCNLRCDMCHYLSIIEDTETHKKYKNEMSAEEVKRAIAELPRHTLITFTGGEAFMKSDFMEILKFACSRHKVHVITNGTLLTEQTVEKLLDMRLNSLWGSGFFYLGVSLEGSEALHDRITTIPGSFRKTTEGLERFIKRRQELNSRYPLVHLTSVINRSNVMDLVALYDYANSLEVNVCNFVVDNPATYWHAKDYNQDQHLQAPAKPVEQISPAILREQLAKDCASLPTSSRRKKLSATIPMKAPTGITDAIFPGPKWRTPPTAMCSAVPMSVWEALKTPLTGTVPGIPKRRKRSANFLKKKKFFPVAWVAVSQNTLAPREQDPNL